MEAVYYNGKVRIESHFDTATSLVPSLLERWVGGNGYIPSEAEMRYHITHANNDIGSFDWCSSTLSAVKGAILKVILPYKNGSKNLTDAARYALGLIKSDKNKPDLNISLSEDDWERLEGEGVYTRKINRDEKDSQNIISGFQYTEIKDPQEARKCPLLMTKLQHPNYVDREFARPADEIEEIIQKSFEMVSKIRHPEEYKVSFKLIPEEELVIEELQLEKGRNSDSSLDYGFFDAGQIAGGNINYVLVKIIRRIPEEKRIPVGAMKQWVAIDNGTLGLWEIGRPLAFSSSKMYCMLNFGNSRFPFISQRNKEANHLYFRETLN